MWKQGKLDRDVSYTKYNLVILSAPAVNQLYPSIKNSEKFINYINSNKV
jgi:hypothetical protein